MQEVGLGLIESLKVKVSCPLVTLNERKTVETCYLISEVNG